MLIYLRVYTDTCMRYALILLHVQFKKYFFFRTAQTNRVNPTRRGRVSADAGSSTRFVSGRRREADERHGRKRRHGRVAPAKQHHSIEVSTTLAALKKAREKQTS